MTLLVLVHSPALGPGSWQPVARRLLELGVPSVVPDLRPIAAGGPPYGPRLATTVAETIAGSPGPAPVILVAHSNAGLFMPSVQQASGRPVAGAVFVDAGLPGPGETPVAPPQFLARLRALAGPDGLLPRWSDWWSAEDLAEVLPDPAVRAMVVAEQPRLPLAYYEQTLPPPDPAWFSVPAAYLQFSEGYAEEAAQARQAGWAVQRLPGEHLHQVIAPDAVAGGLLRLVERLTA